MGFYYAILSCFLKLLFLIKMNKILMTQAKIPTKMK